MTMHTGSMIALVVPDPENYAINPPTKNSTPANELHITLAYLGEAAEITDEQRQAVLEAVQVLTDTSEAPETLFPASTGVFPPDPESAEPDAKAAYYAAPANPEKLYPLREDLLVHLGARGVGDLVSTKHPVFTPHVTLTYESLDTPPTLNMPTPVPVRFTTLIVTFADEVHTFQLGQPQDGPTPSLTASVQRDIEILAARTHYSADYVTALYLRQRQVRATPAQTRSRAALEAVTASLDPEYVPVGFARVRALIDRIDMTASAADRAMLANRALALVGKESPSNPQEARDLGALTASLQTLVADGNSSVARSLRAHRQLRDRYGRWIEMGGGVRFKIRKPGTPGGGSWYHGTVVGMDIPNGRVNVKLEDGRIVAIPNDKLEQPKAILNLKTKANNVIAKFNPKAAGRRGRATPEADVAKHDLNSDIKSKDDAAIPAIDSLVAATQKDATAPVKGGNVLRLVNDNRDKVLAAKESGADTVDLTGTQSPFRNVTVNVRTEDALAVHDALAARTARDMPSAEELDKLNEEEQNKATGKARGGAIAGLTGLYNDHASEEATALRRAPGVNEADLVDVAPGDVNPPDDAQASNEELVKGAADSINHLKDLVPDSSPLADKRDQIAKIVEKANSELLDGSMAREDYLNNLDTLKKIADDIEGPNSSDPVEQAFGAFAEDIDNVHRGAGDSPVPEEAAPEEVVSETPETPENPDNLPLDDKDAYSEDKGYVASTPEMAEAIDRASDVQGEIYYALADPETGDMAVLGGTALPDFLELMDEFYNTDFAETAENLKNFADKIDVQIDRLATAMEDHDISPKQVEGFMQAANDFHNQLLAAQKAATPAAPNAPDAFITPDETVLPDLQEFLDLSYDIRETISDHVTSRDLANALDEVANSIAQTGKKFDNGSIQAEEAAQMLQSISDGIDKMFADPALGKELNDTNPDVGDALNDHQNLLQQIQDSLGVTTPAQVPASEKEDVKPSDVPDYVSNLSDLAKSIQADIPDRAVIENAVPDAVEQFDAAEQAIAALSDSRATSLSEEQDHVLDMVDQMNQYFARLEESTSTDPDAKAVIAGESDRVEKAIAEVEKAAADAGVLEADAPQTLAPEVVDGYINALRENANPMADILANFLENRQAAGEPIMDADMDPVRALVGNLIDSSESTPDEKAELHDVLDKIVGDSFVDEGIPAPAAPEESTVTPEVSDAIDGLADALDRFAGDAPLSGSPEFHAAGLYNDFQDGEAERDPAGFLHNAEELLPADDPALAALRQALGGKEAAPAVSEVPAAPEAPVVPFIIDDSEYNAYQDIISSLDAWAGENPVRLAKVDDIDSLYTNDSNVQGFTDAAAEILQEDHGYIQNMRAILGQNAAPTPAETPEPVAAPARPAGAPAGEIGQNTGLTNEQKAAFESIISDVTAINEVAGARLQLLLDTHLRGESPDYQLIGGLGDEYARLNALRGRAATSQVEAAKQRISAFQAGIQRNLLRNDADRDVRELDWRVLNEQMERNTGRLLDDISDEKKLEWLDRIPAMHVEGGADGVKRFERLPEAVGAKEHLIEARKAFEDGDMAAVSEHLNAAVDLYDQALNERAGIAQYDAFKRALQRRRRATEYLAAIVDKREPKILEGGNRIHPTGFPVIYSPDGRLIGGRGANQREFRIGDKVKRSGNGFADWPAGEIVGIQGVHGIPGISPQFWIAFPDRPDRLLNVTAGMVIMEEEGPNWNGEAPAAPAAPRAAAPQEPDLSSHSIPDPNAPAEAFVAPNLGEGLPEDLSEASGNTDNDLSRPSSLDDKKEILDWYRQNTVNGEFLNDPNITDQIKLKALEHLLFGFNGNKTYGTKGFTVKLTGRSVSNFGNVFGGKTYNLAGQIHDADGRIIGNVSRNIEVGQSANGKPVISVYNALMDIMGNENKKSGFASDWNTNLENWALANHDFSIGRGPQFAVSAALANGGYVWAKFGFKFREPSAADGFLRSAARQAVLGSPEDALIKRLQARRVDGGEVLPIEIAMIGWRPGMKDTGRAWLGRSVMNGKSWSGIKDITPTTKETEARRLFGDLRKQEGERLTANLRARKNDPRFVANVTPLQRRTISNFVADFAKQAQSSKYGTTATRDRLAADVESALTGARNFADLPADVRSLVREALANKMETIAHQLDNTSPEDATAYAHFNRVALREGYAELLQAQKLADENLNYHDSLGVGDELLAPGAMTITRGDRFATVLNLPPGFSIDNNTNVDRSINAGGVWVVKHNRSGKKFLVKRDSYEAGAHQSEHDTNRLMRLIGFRGVAAANYDSNNLIVQEFAGHHLAKTGTSVDSGVGAMGDTGSTMPELADPRQALDMLGITMLMGNTDRHYGNWMVGTDDSNGRFIVPIDNSSNDLERAQREMDTEEYLKDTLRENLRYFPGGLDNRKYLQDLVARFGTAGVKNMLLETMREYQAAVSSANAGDFHLSDFQTNMLANIQAFEQNIDQIIQNLMSL